MENLNHLSQLGSTFFGLTLNNAKQSKINLYSNIHEIIFNSNGGYDWNTLYHFPSWWRHMIFDKIDAYNKKQSEHIESQSNKNSSSVVGPDGKIDRAAFLENSPKAKPTSYN